MDGKQPKVPPVLTVEDVANKDRILVTDGAVAPAGTKNKNDGHDKGSSMFVRRTGPSEYSGNAGSGFSDDYGDLAPFVAVVREKSTNGGDPRLDRYDPDIDIPLPRRHSEVVTARAAKLASDRRRAELYSSEAATRPFSRMNRARTAHLLMLREQRSRLEVEKAQNASLDDRGIDETLTREMRGLNVLEQARHPRLQAVPLLSKVASSAGSKQGRSRSEMGRIANAFGVVEDNDHRAATISVQDQALDDAWVALLGSTLETNRNVTSVLLNRNAIGDKGVALLSASLHTNDTVETLSLGGNRLTDEGARSLAGLLRSGCSSLRALNLAGPNPQQVSIIQSGSGDVDHSAASCIRAPGAAALAQALGDPASCRSGRFLLSLNLALQRVWDAGAIALAAALRRPSCHLEALGLSGTGLTDVAAKAFSRALADGRSGREQRARAANSKDSRFASGGNDAGGDGEDCNEGGGGGGGGDDSFEVVWGREGEVGEEREEAGSDVRDRDIWVIPCSLRRLDLSRNGITDEGARALAAGLQQHALNYSGQSYAATGWRKSRSGVASIEKKSRNTTGNTGATTLSTTTATAYGNPPITLPPTAEDQVERAASAPAPGSRGSEITATRAVRTTGARPEQTPREVARRAIAPSRLGVTEQSSRGCAPDIAAVAAGAATVKMPPALAAHGADEGGRPTAAAISAERQESSPTTADIANPTKLSSGGFTGLDLAFNRIGNAGAAALHRVLTTVSTSTIFLELRGNEGQKCDVKKNENRNESGVNDNKGNGGVVRSERRNSIMGNGFTNVDANNSRGNGRIDIVEEDRVNKDRTEDDSEDSENGGNGGNGNDPVCRHPATSSSSPTLQLLLEEIEDVCAERRRRLQVEQHLDARRRASTAVSALRAASSSSSATVARGATSLPRRTRLASSEGKPFSADGWCRQTPGAPGNAATMTVTRRSSDEGRDDGSRNNLTAGKQGGNSSGSGIGGGGSGIGSGREGLRLLPGSENSCTKPRPLEGALPLRGYYLSPLLDSSFDLLMLREPACDPVDLSLYVNRARHLLDQRRALREEQRRGCYGGNKGDGGGGSTRNGRTGGGTRGGGDIGSFGRRSGVGVVEGSGKGGGGSGPLPGTSGTADAECAVKGQAMAASGKGSPIGPFKKGTIVSPVAIDVEREQVLAERRNLFYVDSDFAARKNARIAGGGRSKVPRSKVLTQKHGNTAFTRELLKGKQQQRSGSGGRLTCPRGLRAHYLGLQNFEYDWGGAVGGSFGI